MPHLFNYKCTVSRKNQHQEASRYTACILKLLNRDCSKKKKNKNYKFMVSTTTKTFKGWNPTEL